MTNTRAKLRETFTEFNVEAELETNTKIKVVCCDNISSIRHLQQSLATDTELTSNLQQYTRQNRMVYMSVLAGRAAPPHI